MNYHPYIAALAVPGVVMSAGSCTERQNEAELKLAEINHLARSIFAVLFRLNQENEEESVTKIEEYVARYEEVMGSFSSRSSILSAGRKARNSVIQTQLEIMQEAESISDERDAEIAAIMEENARLKSALDRYEAANLRAFERMKLSEEEIKKGMQVLEPVLPVK